MKSVSETSVSASSIGASPQSDTDPLADAVLTASRVLIAVAARSLAGPADEITTPQYRALVVLAAHGPQQPVELAHALGLTSSSVTRLCDRLLRKGLIARDRDVESRDRRAVRLSLTDDGLRLLDGVTERRVEEIRRIVERIRPEERPNVLAAFQAFAAAAGEVSDAAWAARWTV